MFANTVRAHVFNPFEYVTAEPAALSVSIENAAHEWNEHKLARTLRGAREHKATHIYHSKRECSQTIEHVLKARSSSHCTVRGTSDGQRAFN